jgi:type II secretory pathway pseudopilin PulG
MHLTPRGAAFSIVEVVMVVVIMAILSGIAVPRFANSISNHRAESAAKRIAADLALARHRAMESNVAQTLTFNTVNLSYQNLAMQDINTASGTYQVFLSMEPYRATSLSAVFGADAEIQFDIYGRPDSAGTVIVGVGSRQKTISLDAETSMTTITD